MNNFIKSAFAAQLLLGLISILHNWHIFRVENWDYFVYVSLLIGAYLTWQAIFNKQLNKTTRIAAVLIGTVPMVVMLGFWAIVLTSLH
jgi:hypothetical protein